jgi:uncharacterized membrane protein YcaP (DUF421 family)
LESVLRATAVFAIVLVVFRITGKRSLAQVTTFDFVLLLIIGDATQEALLGQDYSVTNSAVVISTLLLLDLVLSVLATRWPKAEKLFGDVPTIVVEDGEPLLERMRKLRVSIDDVLEEARVSQGIERLDQIRFAVVERSGRISVVPTH